MKKGRKTEDSMYKYTNAKEFRGFNLESDMLASSWKNTSESQGFIFWMTGDKDLLSEEF